MKKGGTNIGNVPKAPAMKTKTNFASLNSLLCIQFSAEVALVDVYRSLPFDKTTTTQSGPLFDEPGSGKPGNQSRQPENTERPGRAGAAHERVQRDAKDGASQTSAGDNDSVRQPSLATEILCWCAGKDLYNNY